MNYRSEVKVLTNHGQDALPTAHGDRIAQLIVDATSRHAAGGKA